MGLRNKPSSKLDVEVQRSYADDYRPHDQGQSLLHTDHWDRASYARVSTVTAIPATPRAYTLEHEMPINNDPSLNTSKGDQVSSPISETKWYQTWLMLADLEVSATRPAPNELRLKSSVYEQTSIPKEEKKPVSQNIVAS